MSDPNFTSILDMSPDDISEPPLMPAGSYICSIAGLPKQEPASKPDGNPRWVYDLNPISAGPNVDAALLADFGDLNGRKLSLSFFDDGKPNSRDTYNHMAFLRDHAGVPPNKMKQMMADAVGRRVTAHVKHIPSKKSPGKFTYIVDATSKAD